jgi:hypothetical protein
MMTVIFLIIACLHTASGFYSIHYYSTTKSNVIMNAGDFAFTDAPQSNQVADVYTRLSGLPPLLLEDEVNMPTLLDFTSNKQRPYIVEVIGGVLPAMQEMKTVIKSSAFDYKSNEKNPELSSIVEALRTNDIELTAGDFTTVICDSPEKMETAKAILRDVGSTGRPIVILHHEAPASHHYIERQRLLAMRRSVSKVVLEDGDSSGTVTPLTEFQISQYQICLWTAVMFILLLLAGVCSIVQMEVIPDSILYAKFQSGRTGGKFD